MPVEEKLDPIISILERIEAKLYDKPTSVSVPEKGMVNHRSKRTLNKQGTSKPYKIDTAHLSIKIIQKFN